MNAKVRSRSGKEVDTFVIVILFHVVGFEINDKNAKNQSISLVQQFSQYSTAVKPDQISRKRQVAANIPRLSPQSNAITRCKHFQDLLNLCHRGLRFI